MQFRDQKKNLGFAGSLTYDDAIKRGATPERALAMGQAADQQRVTQMAQELAGGGGVNFAGGQAPEESASIFKGGNYEVADSGQIMSDAGRDGFTPQINSDGLGLVLGPDDAVNAGVAELNTIQSGGDGLYDVSVSPVPGSGLGGFFGSFAQGFGGDLVGIGSALRSQDSLIDPRTLVSAGAGVLSFLRDGLIEALPGSGAFEFGREARTRNDALGRSLWSGVSDAVGGLFDNLSLAYNSYQAGDSVGAGAILGEMAYRSTRDIGFALGTAGLSRAGLFADALPGGAVFEGTLYRAVGVGQDPLLIHPGNIDASHRYTGRGQGGLYFATGQHVVEAEFVSNGSSLVGKQMFSFSNSSVPDLLDLSSLTVRESLGVNLPDITRTGGTQAWRYEITQPLGLWAQQNGYRGILAPSAQADGGVNLILFNADGVK